MSRFAELRAKYPDFIYCDYNHDLSSDKKFLEISYDFEITGLAKFNPKWKIPIKSLSYFQKIDSRILDKMVFYLGMVELVSYYKTVCSPNIQIKCGNLDQSEQDFFRKLYYKGLGEFFFVNQIKITPDELLDFEVSPSKNSNLANSASIAWEATKLLLPIGGGKDSLVSLDILQNSNLPLAIVPFGINANSTINNCIEAGGYNLDSAILPKRALDPQLFELNKQNFLNGHTPFSAIVAFSSLLSGYINGCEFIVLSNENSANEATGSNMSDDFNHQYSKSLEFETDFRQFVSANLGEFVPEYFSILRPLSEINIASLFSKLPKYRKIFRSCNLGAKQGIWCGNCAKCLFIFVILLPFLPYRDIIAIFDKDLLEDAALGSEFQKLSGIQEIKPLECVGEIDEVRLALAVAIKNFVAADIKLPLLLDKYSASLEISNEEIADLAAKYFNLNPQNHLPAEFQLVLNEYLARPKND